jgi:fumarylacetoacetate (FAA) hydrolase
MKIGRAITDDGPKTVILHESLFYDLSEITGVDLESAGPSFYYLIQKNIDKIRDFFAQGKQESLQDIIPKSYLIPTPLVNQIRDFYAFEEHVRNARARRGSEVPKEWYEFPVYYYSGNSSLYPSDYNIQKPEFTSELDFEIELAAIIGKEGRNISKSEAWDHIFGFVLMNDWSARDQQRKEMTIGLGPSKSKDFATSFGRYLVTADEVATVLDGNGKLKSEVWVNINGSEFMRNNLSTMHWSFSDLISWASMDVTLRPGDIIMSGTVGNGCILEHGPDKTGWLKPGDSVRFGSDFFGELLSNIV